MTSKTKIIINWSLAALIGFIFIASAMGKLSGGEATIQMAKDIGLREETFKLLGLVELISVLFFLFPRTGILGTLLLSAYMGGAIATHLTHGQSIIAPVIIEAIIWLVAVIRFAELKTRLLTQAKNTKP